MFDHSACLLQEKLAVKVKNKQLLIMVIFSLLSLSLNTVLITAKETQQTLPLSVKQQLLMGQFKLAAKELTTLANAGHTVAQYQLAILLLNGKGVVQSASKAEKWLINSATKHADSAFLLGNLYQKGKQLSLAPLKALKYLKIAAAMGNQRARKLVEQLESSPIKTALIDQKIQAQFILAIKNIDLKQVQEYYYEGANINRADNQGLTPLIIAIKSRSFKIVQWLIQKPLQLDRRDKQGNSAMHYAAKFNQLKSLIAIASQMKDIDNINNNKQTPLIIAVLNGHQQLAQWLVTQKANVNQKDIQDMSARSYARKFKIPLNFAVEAKDSKREQRRIAQLQRKHQLKVLTKQANDISSAYYHWPILLIAVAQKQIHLSKYLLKKGSDPWITNPLAETAISLALVTEQPKLLKLMLKLHPVDYGREKKSIYNIFSLAIKNNNVVLVKKLLSYIAMDGLDDPQNQPIIAAVKANSPAVVDFLLKQMSKKPTGKLLQIAVKANFIDVTATLLLNGSPVNWKNAKGRDALWLAAENSNPNMLSLLLSYQSNVNSSDINGQTALMRSTIKDCLACVKILLSKSADPQRSSLIGNNAVMFAAQDSHKILELFLQKDIDISKRNNQTLTSLMLATKKKNSASVLALLQAGANPKRRNKQGQDAFDFAVESPEILTLLEQY